MEKIKMDEVFEARSLFEADAAKLAAQNRTSQDLEHLQEALSEHENALSLYSEGKISSENMMTYDHNIHLGFYHRQLNSRFLFPPINN